MTQQRSTEKIFKKRANLHFKLDNQATISNIALNSAQNTSDAPMAIFSKQQQLMRVSSSRINREQQLKVVVRLKPQPAQSRYSKNIYLSGKDSNQLIVETGTKREIFQFDHLAHQTATQQQIYKMMAQNCVGQVFEGYNCCLFAYGQTGAGKTFSVLGNLNDLQADLYCQSRGILPRVLEEVFEFVGGRTEGRKVSVSCAYLEIYNEQIFDLLSSDKRIHQIRQDAKKGVFIQGLIQQKVLNYRSAMSLLFQGEKNRKTAFTLMNSQSSRSHAIFSILIQSEIVENETITSRKAKFHMVDLAGSQRVKHTNVEGQRLREGCNINRSLHVLGNVINCLAEASKKKKHIPFRDSNLTHYLKDSLGGNSITKLLANVHTGRQYFGDTLSTLMFAKRAKLVKMKVELNETTAENFDSLRKEVRKLREELAQARYFKSEERMSEGSFQEGEAVEQMAEHHQNDRPPKNETLKILQQNEIHYKALIQIYEQHMKSCLTSSHIQRKQNINIVREWKNLEKRNISLTHLVKQLPLFTKIYREHLLLSQERFVRTEPLFYGRQGHLANEAVDGKLQISYNDVNLQFSGRQIILDCRQTAFGNNQKQGQSSQKEQLAKLVQIYEKIIDELKQKFNSALETLQKSYLDLEIECKAKQKKIKDLKKSWQAPPNLQQLKNENEYLHLSILNLQNQIEKIQQREQKLRVELKQSKPSPQKVESGQEDDWVAQKLMEIHREAERQAAQLDVERAQTQMVVQKLQAEINKYMVENSRLRQKYSKSKSKNRSHSRKIDEVQSAKHNMVTPGKKEYVKSQAKYGNSSAVGVSAFGQSHSYTKEILTLKMDIKRKQKEIHDLRKELEDYVRGDRRIEEEFGRTLQQIIEEYRSERKMLQQSKSVKNLGEARQAREGRERRREEREGRERLNPLK